MGKCNVEKSPRVSAVGQGLVCPCHLPLGKAQTSWVNGRQGGGVNGVNYLCILNALFKYQEVPNPLLLQRQVGSTACSAGR